MYPEFVLLVKKYDDIINNHTRCVFQILATDGRDIHAQRTVMGNDHGTTRRQNSMPISIISSENECDVEVSDEEDDEAQARNRKQPLLSLLTFSVPLHAAVSAYGNETRPQHWF